MNEVNAPAATPAPASPARKLPSLDQGLVSNLVLVATLAVLGYLAYNSAKNTPPAQPAAAPAIDVKIPVPDVKIEPCPRCPRCPRCPNGGSCPNDGQVIQHLPEPGTICPGPQCPQQCRCLCLYCACGCRRRGDLPAAPAPVRPAPAKAAPTTLVP